MKALIVLCSLLALGLTKPGGWSYSTVDLANPAFVAARTYAAAPYVATHPYAAASYVAAAPVVASRTVAAAPLVATGPAVAAAPVVAARTLAAAPVVATGPAVAAAPIVATRTVAAAPVIATAPAAVKTQWHAQDEIGQASYGHAEPAQSHTAVQDAHGNKIGSFSYLNPTDGLVHRTDYIADSLGYRVVANDLPVAAAGPVVDTPEVAIARAAHLAAVHRAKRGILVSAAHTPASTVPLATPLIAAAPAFTTYAAGAPIVAPGAISYSAPLVATHSVAAAPLVAAAPVLRDATLTTVVNTPGHAVSYRIY